MARLQMIFTVNPGDSEAVQKVTKEKQAKAREEAEGQGLKVDLQETASISDEPYRDLFISIPQGKFPVFAEALLDAGLMPTSDVLVEDEFQVAAVNMLTRGAWDTNICLVSDLEDWEEV